MIFSKFKKRMFAPSLIALLFMSSSALPANQANEYFESARDLYQIADYQDALIQLKNALQIDRTHSEALLLMGEINLRYGANAAAEYVFQQALEHGAEPQPTMLRLAEAYLKQGKLQSILNDLEIKDANTLAAAEIMGYRAVAHFGGKQPDKAKSLINSALSIQPNALMPRIVKIQMLMISGEIPSAVTAAKALIRDHSGAARAWASLGFALAASNDYEAAIAAYKKAIGLDAYLLLPRFQRIKLLIETSQNEEALADIEFLSVYFPMDPRPAFFRGMIHEEAEEYEAAKNEFRRCSDLISTLPEEIIAESVELTIQAAVSHLRLGEEESARTYLQNYHTLNPDNVIVGKTLTTLLIAAKDTGDAEKIINRLLESNPLDEELLALKASAYKQSGQPGKAIETLLRIAILGVEEFDEQTYNALRHIGKGEIEAGQEGIRDAIDNQRLPEKESYDLAKVYLVAGQYPQAVLLAAALVRLHPDNLNYLNLLGTSLMQAGKLEEAYATLKQAELQDSNDAVTQLNLARLETKQGRIAAALNRLNRGLDNHPKNTDILFQLARIQQLQGNSNAAVELSQRALAISPGWSELRIYLVRLFLEMSMAEQAIQMAKEGIYINQKDMELQFLLGEALESAGQLEKAKAIYSQIRSNSLFDASLLRRTADAQIRIQALYDASYSLFRSLQIKPEHVPTRIKHIRVELAIKNFLNALEYSEILVNEYPGEATTHVLKAESLAGLDRYKEASQEYLTALKIDPGNTPYTIGAFRNLNAAGKTNKGESLIVRALESAPDTVLLSVSYISFLMREKRWQDSETVLLSSLKYFPNNPVLLNNMAYVLHKQQKKDALNYAHRAYESAPEIAQINDTLGWVMTETGQVFEGVEYLKVAAKQLSDNPDVIYHLAVAYSRLGYFAKSNVELKKAVLMDVEFDNLEKASELLKSNRLKLEH